MKTRSQTLASGVSPDRPHTLPPPTRKKRVKRDEASSRVTPQPPCHNCPCCIAWMQNASLSTNTANPTAVAASTANHTVAVSTANTIAAASTTANCTTVAASTTDNPTAVAASTTNPTAVAVSTTKPTAVAVSTANPTAVAASTVKPTAVAASTANPTVAVFTANLTAATSTTAEPTAVAASTANPTAAAFTTAKPTAVAASTATNTTTATASAQTSPPAPAPRPTASTPSPRFPTPPPPSSPALATQNTMPPKRKRHVSPESIPNPPGCSYGMDTRYFWYSSEEDDDEEEEKAEGPPAKKSKVEVVYPPPPPITNMSGTFRLDYDTYGSSDEEEEVEGGAIGPSRINAEEALARARLLAEKYKPKQPSGLRASSRLSTSTVNSDVLETPVAAAEVEMDMGVDEAVGTIPEEALLQFTFPGPFPELMEVDPEVQTFLAASWGTEHSHRAHEGFEYGLSEYKREKGLLA